MEMKLWRDGGVPAHARLIDGHVPFDKYRCNIPFGANVSRGPLSPRSAGGAHGATGIAFLIYIPYTYGASHIPFVGILSIILFSLSSHLFSNIPVTPIAFALLRHVPVPLFVMSV